MALLKNVDIRYTFEDLRASGALNSGDAFRGDKATGTFNSLAANAYTRLAMLSGFDVTRGRIDSQPADGEAYPHRYDNGVTDIGAMTYENMYDNAAVDTNPTYFFRTLFHLGEPFQIVIYPSSASTTQSLTFNAHIDSYRVEKSGGAEQKVIVGFTFNGEGFNDAR